MAKGNTTTKKSKTDIFKGSFAATLTKGLKHGPVKDGNYVRLESGLQVSARKGGYALVEGVPSAVKVTGLKQVGSADVKGRRRFMVTEADLTKGQKLIKDASELILAAHKAHAEQIAAKQGKGSSGRKASPVKTSRQAPKKRTAPVPLTAK
jgi:hypothetical protein